MKKIILKTILFTVLVCLFSCESNKEPIEDSSSSEENTTSKKENNNLNINILLDLSDRIDPEKYPNSSMEYYQRDAQYINIIAQTFIKHLKSKKVILLNDKMSLYFSPEPSNPEINSISKELKVNFDRNSSKHSLSATAEKYKTLPVKIYESAIKDKNYVGSDIWRFFKDNVKNYCVEDDYRNILVILTDGYMYHKNSEITEGNQTTFLTPQLIRQFHLNNSDWKQKIEKEQYGFIPAENELNNLEVLVIGIRPDEKNPFEGDIIKAYWEEWLKQMNISKFKLLNNDLPSNLEKPISEFLLNNISS